MLTRVQVKALAYIAGEIRGGRPCPSLQEVATHLGFVSRSTAKRVVDQLVSRGALERQGGHQRGLRLSRGPESFDREAEAVECLRKLVALSDAVGSPGWDRAMVWARRIVEQRGEP